MPPGKPHAPWWYNFWYDSNNDHYGPTTYRSGRIGTHHNSAQNLQSHLDDFQKRSTAWSPVELAATLDQFGNLTVKFIRNEVEFKKIL